MIRKTSRSYECQSDQIRFWINHFLALSALIVHFVQMDRQGTLSPSFHLALDCVFKCQIYVFIINSVKRLTRIQIMKHAREQPL